jgi:hypothetical protein
MNVMFHNENKEVARKYLEWARKCLAAFDEGKKVQTSWSGKALNREEWRAEFVDVLNKRINMKAGAQPNWRKLNGTYQMWLMRDSQRLKDMKFRRIRVYQFETQEARIRFSDRLSSREDW